MARVTGLGAVSSLGRGVGPLWSAMVEGRDGIAPIKRFATEIELGATVPDRNSPDHAAASQVSCLDFAESAAREAWSTAKLDRIPPDRIALVFGSSLGDTDVEIVRVTEQLGAALGIRGPRLTVTTACASSTNAIGLGLELLRLGVADAVVAGGADVLTPLVLAGFHALGVLATGKCAPFSEPAGTTLGEGAGFLVLERGEGTGIVGYGLSADAFHDTGPDPSGAGVARAIQSALADAGIAPDQIDYVNAHGTGTRANDPAEWRAIQHVLGERAARVPVSSSKSFLGHAQGAAGVLETIATLIALEHHKLPPTQRHRGPRPQSPVDAVAQDTARDGECRFALSNSSGFGGTNCALVVGAGDRTPVRREVAIRGHASVRASEVDFERSFPAIDPRGLDSVTRTLIAGVAGALDGAKLKVHGAARDRSGLVVGTTAASVESTRALNATIATHGYRGLSTNLFSRQVVNAAPGTCARLLGLRGPHSVVAAGEATGLFAILYAAQLMATREVDQIVAGGLDEAEGAAFVVIGTAGSARIAGYSIAGPGELDRAIREARAIANVDQLRELPAAAGSFDSAAQVVAATQLIERGEARAVLIAQRGGASADCALILTGGT